MTIQEIKTQSKNLTENENKVIDALYGSLECYFGDDYSDVDVSDVHDKTGIDAKSLRGTLSSLVKKNVISVNGNGSGFYVITFKNQINF